MNFMQVVYTGDGYAKPVTGALTPKVAKDFCDMQSRHGSHEVRRYQWPKYNAIPIVSWSILVECSIPKVIESVDYDFVWVAEKLYCLTVYDIFTMERVREYMSEMPTCFVVSVLESESSALDRMLDYAATSPAKGKLLRDLPPFQALMTAALTMCGNVQDVFYQSWNNVCLETLQDGTRIDDLNSLAAAWMDFNAHLLLLSDLER